VNKKYLIVLVLSIVAAVGFFIFNDHKNEKELATHRDQRYESLIELANKSAIAGMSQMGEALNKYREEKGAYPAKLSELYPDYIPAKGFIDDIQWYYEPRGEDFYLSKTYTTAKNKEVTAAIGSDLRLRQESMVASFDKPKNRKTAKPDAIKPQPSLTMALAKNPALQAEADNSGPYSGRRQTAATEASTPQKSNSTQTKSLYARELVSMGQLSEKEQYVKRVKGNFLVWKKEDGTVAFGNVQYPFSEKMTIYDEGEWIQIHNRSPKSNAGGAIQHARAEKAATAERLAEANSSRFLTWKNPEGTVCFGNVQYPNNQDIQIHVAGSWQSAKNW
jgi:hypothetical protein